MNPKKQNNKKLILERYGCVTALLFLICIAVTAKMIKTTVIDADKWNERAVKELNRTKVIKPERGSILAANGNILACNITVYNIRLDLRHPRFSKLTKEQWKALDQFADSLDRLYPRNSRPDSPDRQSWRTLLHSQLKLKAKERKSAVTIAFRRPIEEFEHLRHLPFMSEIKSNGRGCPLYAESESKRIYPFGEMARLSVGRVYENEKTGEVRGYAGLEKALDTLLYGHPGRTRSVAMNSGIGEWVDVPAVRGYDVRTTIDIDIQDILEAELLKICRDSVFPVSWGTAVLMEVRTGEIKAISNVEKLKDGTWGEAMNRAVQPVEPGSVVKPISLMIAFEDGLVKRVSDMVDTSPFQGTTDPHKPDVKDMRGVIGWSSNTGISRIIFRGYSDDPSKYYDRLKSIGLMDPMNSGIGGEQTGRVSRIVTRKPNGQRVTRTAQLLDLSRQAYGYAVEIPPLYTLAYINAMANDGKMVRPHLVHSLILPDGRDSVVNPGYMRQQVCSPQTAAMMRECLLEPVWGHGTANALRDDRVKVAGKTGTAYPYDYKVLHAYDMSRRRYSFCGYFPADNPRYSCIVVMEAPKGFSAARLSGRVLLNVALKLYAKGLLEDATGPTAETGVSSGKPVLYGSNAGNTATLVQGLGLKDARQIRASHSAPTPGVVPDLTGLDAASAVRQLEKAGYRPRLVGHGYVTGQSVKGGTRLRRGSRVSITLRP